MNEFDIEAVVQYFSEYWGEPACFPSATVEDTYYIEVGGPFDPSDFEVISDACYDLGFRVTSVDVSDSPLGLFSFRLEQRESVR